MQQMPSNLPLETPQNVFSQPLSIFGVPVDRESIFTNHKGVHKPRIEKRQRKLIAKITQVSHFLLADERIVCLTTCYSPISVLEQVLTGPSFLYFKRAVLIFTDRRILHVPTSFNLCPHSAVSQIMYEDCAKISLTGRSLVVLYKNREQEQFLYIGRKEKLKIRALINKLPLKPKEAGQLQQRVHLCPGCAAVLQKGSAACSSCKMSFKTDRKAKMHALLIPGGGYFYSRYPFIGMVTGLVELIAMAIIILYLANLSLIPIGFGLFAIALAAVSASKTIGLYHGRILITDFMPVEKEFTFRKN
jgi:hypothetical protein